jgi:hypothetical protein
MAVFSWICDLRGHSLQDRVQPVLEGLQLRLDPDFCNHDQLYALDNGPQPEHAAAGVRVLATWTTPERCHCLVEVRSGEPQLRPGTRCQQLAEGLRQQLPALAAA